MNAPLHQPDLEVLKITRIKPTLVVKTLRSFLPRGLGLTAASLGIQNELPWKQR